MINSQRDISDVTSSHFKKVFEDPWTTLIDEQLQVIHKFPCLFLAEDNCALEKPVTLTEVEDIKICAKEKSLRPYGWTVEFYLGFWDLVGQDIVDLVEESRGSGFISSTLNSTFISLTPKHSKPSSFDYFRPISLYNFLYKIISKIIAKHIKPFLSKVITQKQFGFLTHRQILDTVEVTREGIHSIKAKGL